MSNTSGVCCSSSLQSSNTDRSPSWSESRADSSSLWLCVGVFVLFCFVFYFLEEWEEVKDAVLASLCVSICLQFLRVLVCVCPSLVATQNFP